MTDSLSIALAQLDPIVGDTDGNREKIRAARKRAAENGADLLVFTECVVSGYPPDDLVLKPAFQEAVREEVECLAADTADGGPGMIVGAPWRENGRLHNAGLLLDEGRIAAARYKHDLPNYGVFDEKRIFVPGQYPGPVNFRGVRLGLMVCEDMWSPEVPECLEENGAEILVAINASPFETGKEDVRLNLAVSRVTETRLPLIYVNQVGGQDELVFDGASFVLGSDSGLRAQLPAWREKVLTTRWRRRGNEGWECEEAERAPPSLGAQAVYEALVLGTRDYVNKNHFPGVLIGLSGGIDSALTAAVAVDALGPDRVHCVLMPSPYTAPESIEDARETARRLGVRLDTIPITPAMEAFDEMLREVFVQHPRDTTEENIQARTRAIVLMALSNKFGHMLLSTGNKSEMSVGYSTLYGDMCGGFNVLKDVYKTTVYAVARWRNGHMPPDGLGAEAAVIPERVLTKAPSAELKPNQTDQETLPPYDELDDILVCLIEEDQGVDDIVARGHDRKLVEEVWRMLETAEYKRRQAPPGVKVTRRSFGRDRRYPITNDFKGAV